MRIVVTRLLDVVYKSDELKERYIRGLKDISTITDIYFKTCHIFKNMSSCESHFPQLSLETFVKEARQISAIEFKETTVDTPITPPTQPSPPTFSFSPAIIR